MKHPEPLQDRATLRRTLSVLDEMVSKIESGERIEIADAAAVLVFLSRESAGDGALVTQIQDALRTRKAREFVSRSRQLSALLRNQLEGKDGAISAPPAKPEFHAGLLRLEQKYAKGGIFKTAQAALGIQRVATP